MKNQNFRSVTVDGMTPTPHQVYQGLAVDAVLLSVNDQLPSMSDEQQKALVEAAQLAANTVLAAANVPADWLSIVEALNRNHEDELRGELHDIVFELMGQPPKHILEEQRVAIDRVCELCLPGRRADLHDALLDLELALFSEVLDACQQAFRVGYEVARNPSKLLFEKAVGGE